MVPGPPITAGINTYTTWTPCRHTWHDDPPDPYYDDLIPGDHPQARTASPADSPKDSPNTEGHPPHETTRRHSRRPGPHRLHPARGRHVARMARAGPSPAEAFAATLPPGPVVTHSDRWERIAWCESGGNWSMRATNRTGTYGGGLAIRDDVWRHYGGTAYAPNAGWATRAQQITIAERIWNESDQGHGNASNTRTG